MIYSGGEQLLLVLQSALVGMLIGGSLDFNHGIALKNTHISHVLVLDITWGCLSAVMTFFAALVLTDGQLHPVLLLGLLIGALVEHYTIGRALKWMVCKTRMGARKAILWSVRVLNRSGQTVCMNAPDDVG